MSEEIPFRVTLAVILVIFAAVLLRAVLVAGLRRSIMIAPREGIFLASLVRLLVLASAVTLVAYIVEPHRIPWGYFEMPEVLRWSGIAFATVGLFVFFAAIRALGGRFSTSLQIREQDGLVQSGPYRLVRHPMYLAYQLLWISFLFLSANVMIGGLGLLAFAIVMVVRTPREERMLRETYGNVYETYSERTGRFLPRCLTRGSKR